MAVFLLIGYALLLTGLFFCVIAGASREHDRFVRRLEDARRETNAYRDLYYNAIHQLGEKENSQLSTLNSQLPKEYPHAKS